MLVLYLIDRRWLQCVMAYCDTLATRVDRLQSLEVAIVVLGLARRNLNDGWVLVFSPRREFFNFIASILFYSVHHFLLERNPGYNRFSCLSVRI